MDNTARRKTQFIKNHENLHFLEKKQGNSLTFLIFLSSFSKKFVFLCII